MELNVFQMEEAQLCAAPDTIGMGSTVLLSETHPTLSVKQAGTGMVLLASSSTTTTTTALLPTIGVVSSTAVSIKHLRPLANQATIGMDRTVFKSARPLLDALQVTYTIMLLDVV